MKPRVILACILALLLIPIAAHALVEVPLNHYELNGRANHGPAIFHLCARHGAELKGNSFNCGVNYAVDGAPSWIWYFINPGDWVKN